MASKYDDFWRATASEFARAVTAAASGDVTILAVPGLASLGNRTSWHGSVAVRGRSATSDSMAHATSLGNVVADLGLCDAFPDTTFRFTISNRLEVSVTTVGAKAAHAIEAARERATRTPAPEGQPSVAASACARLHTLLALLPSSTDPAEVPFDNGLYFFYEVGERNLHGEAGRIVRVGNHPRSVDRLRKRLGEHLATRPGAKNGSVFRRYLGGALLRSTDPNHPCLSPAPGAGHWEHQGDATCERCSPIERDVTAHLRAAMTFRCVRIDDTETRNHLEAVLIATVAQCDVCRPSEEWLGRHCYQTTVVRTGLWNTEFVDGPTATEADLATVERLTGNPSTPSTSSESVPNPAARSAATAIGRNHDLSGTLLVIPCCSSKHGVSVPELPRMRVEDFISPGLNGLLEEGRLAAWQHPKTSFDAASPLRPAIAWYTGQPYATRGFRNALLDGMERGLHCLIVSGGYGLLRPEEPIHRYGAHMPTQTRGIWSRRLRVLLPDYVERNGIRRAFIAVSASYAGCLPRGFAAEEWWGIPEFDSEVDRGSAMQVVPAKVGALVVDLFSTQFQPNEQWVPAR